jgi:hypothetical protein
VRSRLRRGYASAVVVLISVAFLGLTMTSPAISTTTDFSIFNSGWNGASDLAILTYKAGKFVPTFEIERTGTEMTIVPLDLKDIGLDPLTSALAIIGPTKPFSEEEGSIVGDFVRHGGVLLLADDFGTGNDLLEGMGATSRFSGELVMDLAYDKKPECSVCFDVRPDDMTRDVSTLLLNHPSSLKVDSATSEVFAYSSVASWLDINNNRNQEWGEPRGPFPILAREVMDQGTIILLSDPSVLINGMSEHLDNAIFGTNLMAEASVDRYEVFFDESHRDFFDPVSVMMVFTGVVSPEAKFAVAALAFALALWIATDIMETTASLVVRTARKIAARIARILHISRRKRDEEPSRGPVDIESVVSEAMAKHPDWRAGLVRYLAREGQRHSTASTKRERGHQQRPVVDDDSGKDQTSLG